MGYNLFHLMTFRAEIIERPVFANTTIYIMHNIHIIIIIEYFTYTRQTFRITTSDMEKLGRQHEFTSY